MAKYFLIVGVLLSAESKLLSQNIESIATDRPDQTETPHTVPKNHFQMETGFSFEQTDKYTKTYAYPAALLKYGLTDRMDLRLVTEFTSEKNSTVNTTGLNPVDIGFKVNLVREKGIIPITSFIGHLGIPSFASKDHKAIFYAPAFRFTMQHTLSRNIDLGYNFGARWDGETPEPEFTYTLTTGFGISEKVGAYAEIYGFAPQYSSAYHSFDGGFSYLIHENMLVDISGGFGLTNNAPDYFVAVGFSFRLPN